MSSMNFVSPNGIEQLTSYALRAEQTLPHAAKLRKET